MEESEATVKERVVPDAGFQWIDTNVNSYTSNELTNGLVAFNTAIVGPENWAPIAAYVRAGDGSLIGGMQGYTHWTWLHIDQAWVNPNLRHSGIGSKALLAIEELAISRGCDNCLLDTFSFQAEGFYARHGYVRSGFLEDYPIGHGRVFLTKKLS